jgi:phosphoribosylcarboxyaminoimidazole (NCAIR) mutase
LVAEAADEVAEPVVELVVVEVVADAAVSEALDSVEELEVVVEDPEGVPVADSAVFAQLGD